MAPEVILDNKWDTRNDIYSLGLTLLEWFTGRSWKDTLLTRENLLSCVMFAKRRSIEKKKKSGIAADLLYFELEEALEELPSEQWKSNWLHMFVIGFILKCLCPVEERSSVVELKKMAIFENRNDNKDYDIKKKYDINYNLNKNLKNQIPSDIALNPLRHASQKLLIHIWKLNGGDPLFELKSMIHDYPKIESIPLAFTDGHEVQRREAKPLKEILYLTVSLHKLSQRLKSSLQIDYSQQQILIDHDHLKQDPIDFTSPQQHSTSVYSMNIDENNAIRQKLKECQDLSLKTKEIDAEYQFYRVLLFERLLADYPSTLPLIRQEAAVDIPPFCRAAIWAALLGVIGQGTSIEGEIDYTSSVYRQIEVDVPRCHPYHPLLNSTSGQENLKRLLYVWSLNNTRLAYWQGLDSVASPFLCLFFQTPSIALSCLEAFIPRFLDNLFLHDNSKQLQETLALFHQLISFHDPELNSHLHSIGFLPDLYAIPWFLTCFTHVFSLSNTMHFWDKLLVTSPILVLLMGVSLLQEVRMSLIHSEFNECILLFSDMPVIDIEVCLDRALEYTKVTPPSVMNCCIDLNQRKNELVPRVRWDDVLLMGSLGWIVDVRGSAEYIKSHCKRSVRHDPNVDLVVPVGKQFVIIAGESEHGKAQLAYFMVVQHVSHVCLLHDEEICHCGTTPCQG